MYGQSSEPCIEWTVWFYTIGLDFSLINISLLISTIIGGLCVVVQTVSYEVILALVLLSRLIILIDFNILT